MEHLNNHDEKRTVELKSRLLRQGWGEAIQLLETIIAHNIDGYLSWLNTKCSTIVLFNLAKPYENWNMYNQRTGNLPFKNDVYAIDDCSINL